MVEVVGRPVMMLYPIYYLLLEAVALSNEIETRHREGRNRITPGILLQIFKIIFLFFGAFQLMRLLSMYTGLGYTCLFIGAAAVFTASNDELTKSVAPVVAPHMVALDRLLYSLKYFEDGAMARMNALTLMGSGHLSEFNQNNISPFSSSPSLSINEPVARPVQLSHPSTVLALSPEILRDSTEGINWFLAQSINYLTNLRNNNNNQNRDTFPVATTARFRGRTNISEAEIVEEEVDQASSGIRRRNNVSHR
jgi:hypothetical protein